MKTFAWLVAGLALLVGAIMVEGWRQERRLRARGETRGSRPSLIGSGALELQRHLEPERKVEIVQQEARQADRVRPEHRPGARERGPGDR